MNQYKYFVQEGSLYTMKALRTINYVLITLGIGMLLISFFLMKNDKTVMIWTAIFGVLFILAGVIGWNNGISLDTASKTMNVRVGIRKSSHYFRDFQGFTLHSTTYLGIPINRQLIAEALTENGKTKAIPVAATFFSAKILQQIADEATEIIHHSTPEQS